MSLMLAAFVIVFGFVTAGIIASASALYQNSDGSIQLSLETPMGMTKSFLLCMFVGPYVIAKNGLFLWGEQKIGLHIFSMCLLVAVIWSFCIGVVTIQMLVGLGLV